jgi:hypothetical protein
MLRQSRELPKTKKTVICFQGYLSTRSVRQPNFSGGYGTSIQSSTGSETCTVERQGLYPFSPQGYLLPHTVLISSTYIYNIINNNYIIINNL